MNIFENILFLFFVRYLKAFVLYYYFFVIFLKSFTFLNENVNIYVVSYSEAKYIFDDFGSN